MKSKRSLRNLNLLYFGLGIALPMLLLGCLLIGTSVYYVRKDITHRNNLFVRSLTSQIERHLKKIEDNAVLDIESLSEELNKDNSQQVLGNKSYYVRKYLKVVVTDLAGIVLAVGPRDNATVGTDISRHSFFEKTLKSKNVVWSTSFLEGTLHDPVVTLSLKRKDKVYICYLDLVEIGDIVDFQNTKFKTRMMLVDQKGTYIAHPEHEKVNRRERDIYFEEIKRGYQGRSFAREIDKSGDLMFGDFVPVTGWATLLYIDSKDIYQDLNSLLWILLIILVVVVSATTFVIARHSSYLRAELLKFVGVIKRYEGGDYSRKIGHSKYDELSSVADCLNSMADAVKDRERSIVERDELIRTIIEGSPASVAYVDTSGVHKYINKNYASTFDFDEDREGVLIRDVCSSEARLSCFQQQFENALAGHSSDEEINIVFPDGKNKKTFRSYMTPHLCADSKTHGVIIFLLDVSRRMQLEKELRQAHKLKAVGTLAGGIAHDFNNILCAILGNAQLLQYMLTDSDERSMKKLDSIVQGCQRAASLVEQILAFSKNHEHSKKNISLSPVVKEVLTLVRASFPATIDIQSTLNSDSLVRADQTQIHQVLMNLCTNAKHAMEDSMGTLRIELSDVWANEIFVQEFPGMTTGRYVRLAVTDTGCGMSSHVQERLFEPFFSTRKKEEGTGLGLSVVHGIVESSGGRISVLSEVGKGTTFNIYLPVQKPNDFVSDGESSRDVEDLQGSEEIFIVDDENSILEVLASILRLFGYSVRSMNCSVEAFGHLRENAKRYDLVVTDIDMPKVAGVDMVKLLKEVDPDIPIVMTTGYLEKKVEVMLRDLGADAIIMKPYAVEKVGKVIKGLLDISRKA